MESHGWIDGNTDPFLRRVQSNGSCRRRLGRDFDAGKTYRSNNAHFAPERTISAPLLQLALLAAVTPLISAAKSPCHVSETVSQTSAVISQPTALPRGEGQARGGCIPLPARLLHPNSRIDELLPWAYRTDRMLR